MVADVNREGTVPLLSTRIVPSGELTMDHIVPLARKGKSTKGNVVPSCRLCNAKQEVGDTS